MLFDARFESSISPPIRVTSDDVFGGSAQSGTGEQSAFGFSPVSFVRKAFLWLVRPKLRVESDFGRKTIAPYGEPFPWQIGLTLMLLGVAYIGHLLFLAVRRAAR